MFFSLFLYNSNLLCDESNLLDTWYILLEFQNILPNSCWKRRIHLYKILHCFELTWHLPSHQKVLGVSYSAICTAPPLYCKVNIHRVSCTFSSCMYIQSFLLPPALHHYPVQHYHLPFLLFPEHVSFQDSQYKIVFRQWELFTLNILVINKFTVFLISESWIWKLQT